jgi:hypothetical protein
MTRLVAVAAIVVALAAPSSAGEGALGVADLAAYRAALSVNATRNVPPVPVTFRELWDHPATYQGRRVQVVGRVVRRFRQGSFGTFPPLEEAWAVTPASDPFCLVFPEIPPDPKSGRVAGQVRFVGTFLRLVEYQGGDGPRLAPLIVGPAAPIAARAAVAPARRSSPAPAVAARPTRLDWTVGLAAATLVFLVLAFQHLRKPVRRLLDVEDAPAPLFDDAMAPAGVPRQSDSR